ncbi:MAG: RsmB/NOP family class I SAM-dependent RNA methyltransferase [Nitrososphaerota archaeon]
MEARRYLGFQDNVNPPIYAVLNKLKKNEEEIIKIAEENNVHLRIDKRLPGIYILEAEDTRRLKKLLDAGLITIQDFSSYYAVRILDPKPQEKILDVCSAPGTKTFLMTLNMKNRGLIVSIDSSWTRIKGQKKRMKFLGVEIAYEIQADARYPLPIQEKFDKVIVDPPCSSTGLIWREPFYRWFIKPRHIRAFAKLQSEILNTSSKYVKDGGLLLYSTCSITIEENEYVVEDFLKMNPEFSLVDIEIEVGSRGLRGLEESRRLYPHRDLCNGFFVTLFRKKD